MTSIPLTRRLAPVLLVGGLLLTACTDGSAPTTESAAASSSEDGGSSASSTLPPAEGTTPYPLTLRSPYGETTLEERPERVAILGTFDLDPLLTLGITPVAALSTSLSDWSWLPENLEEDIDVVLDSSDGISVEAVAATDPDLIIAFTDFTLDGQSYSNYAQIAPVLTAEETIAFGQQDWREIQLQIGVALDLENLAQEAIDKTESLFDSIRSKNPNFADKTVSIINDYGEEWGIEYYTPTGSIAESVILDLGFSPNPLATNFVDNSTVSNELLPLIDADVLLVAYNGGDESRAALEADLLFQALPVVQNGNYIVLPEPEDGTDNDGASITWALRGATSSLSLPWAANKLVDLLGQADLS